MVFLEIFFFLKVFSKNLSREYGNGESVNPLAQFTDIAINFLVSITYILFKKGLS